MLSASAVTPLAAGPDVTPFKTSPLAADTADVPPLEPLGSELPPNVAPFAFKTRLTSD